MEETNDLSNNMERKPEKEISIHENDEIERDVSLEINGNYSQFTENDPNIDNILTSIFRAFDTADIIDNIEADSIYQVVVPHDIQKAIDTGEKFFEKDKETGELFAYVARKNENGQHRITNHLKMKERDIVHGNTIHDISMNIQNANFQRQLSELKDLVQNTYDSVLHIEKGQTNDRLAHLDAGEYVLKQALSITNNPELQLQLFSEGISELNQARSEIFHDLEQKTNDFKPIPQDWKRILWYEFKQKGWFQQCDQSYIEIQYLFDCFLKSTTLIGGAYAYLGQEDAIIETFKQSHNDIMKLDFSKVKTIQRIHINKSVPLLQASSFVESEKEFILENFDNTKCKIEISGNRIIRLLESNKDGK